MRIDHYLLASWIGVSLVLGGVAQAAAEKLPEISPCRLAELPLPKKAGKPSRAERKILAHIQSLREFGYSASIAERIARTRPDIATALVELPDDSFRNKRSGLNSWLNFPGLQHPMRTTAELRRPVTMYRGICADLTSYNPAYQDFHAGSANANTMFVSTDRSVAEGYQRRCGFGQPSGLLLKYEIPLYLVAHARDDNYVVPRMRVPDDLLFLTEIGTDLPGQGAREVSFDAYCQWKKAPRQGRESARTKSQDASAGGSTQ